MGHEGEPREMTKPGPWTASQHRATKLTRDRRNRLVF